MLPAFVGDKAVARIIDTIEGPEDLKVIGSAALEQLARELREELIATVSHNGGHLASNLGVVELTLGLHRVFDSPRDKIVWDVGHQAYAHKLLTGRRERFSTIRSLGGLSGYTDRGESPHDPFGAGHASTAVSAALGMALARDMAQENYHVVAVLGDGALTGGMAFEALNHAGHAGTHLIVVLNDNGMSISRSVGALSRVLRRLRLDPSYYRTKEGAERALTRLPLGRGLWGVGRWFRNALKRLLIPTLIWEELGFTYIGPIDGHNLRQVEMALSQAKTYSLRPTFLHIVTQKGKGFAPAEADAVRFHGVSPNNGSAKGAAITYSEVFGTTVARLMRRDPRVVAITAAMLEGTGLAPVAKEFPGQVLDVGICEQHAVTLAAGLATQGYRPIVAIYSTFLQRAYDQILHDVCLQNLPVVFCLDRGGIVGDDGKTHQGLFDLTYLRPIPGIVLSAPRDENQLQHLIYTAYKAKAPMAVRYPRGSGLGVPLDEELRELPLGRGEILREGQDVAILALGNRVAPALEAAEALAQEGIDCLVADARFVKPLDEELIINVARRTRRVVTVEENVVAGGFGSAVLELLAASGTIDVSVRCLGIPDEFVAHGPADVFRSHYGIDAEGIAQEVLRAFPQLRMPLPSLARAKK